MRLLYFQNTSQERPTKSLTPSPGTYIYLLTHSPPLSPLTPTPNRSHPLSTSLHFLEPLPPGSSQRCNQCREQRSHHPNHIQAVWQLPPLPRLPPQMRNPRHILGQPNGITKTTHHCRLCRQHQKQPPPVNKQNDPSRQHCPNRRVGCGTDLQAKPSA